MKQLKRKYRKVRREFRDLLFQKFREDRTLAVLIIETYVSWQHRNHIMQIWSMFRNPEFRNFHKAYTKELLGKHLTGNSDVWRSFYFAGYKDLYNYRTKIPEKFAMGDALGVAYKVLREFESKEKNN